VFVRPSMDTVPGDTAGDATPPTSQPNPSGKEPGQ
jgi:hypothetical protein